MMYPFMTLADETEITYSEIRADGTIEVYIETPDEKDGFHNIKCILPKNEWVDNDGYSEPELEYFKELVTNNAQLIVEHSQNRSY